MSLLFSIILYIYSGIAIAYYIASMILYTFGPKSNEQVSHFQKLNAISKIVTVLALIIGSAFWPITFYLVFREARR